MNNDEFENMLKQDTQQTEEGKMEVKEKDRSLNIGVVGVGQAGSRIAEVFYKYGYAAGVLNTAQQDLKFIQVPEENKLFLDFGLGGAGKDLSVGEGAIIQYQEEIGSFIDAKVVQNNDMLFLAISGGGGTGSGSVEPMLQIMAQFQRPLGVIYVLPLNTDDAQAKKNSITTLAKLAKMASTDAISTLIIVDNAKLEMLYGNLSQSEFWKAGNHAIVEPFHLFNKLTAQPSEFTSLDSTDFGKIIAQGDCSLYGSIVVEDYMEETSLSEHVMKSLEDGLLASGFDLKTSKVGGVIVVGSKEALKKLPAQNINYMYYMIGELTDNANIFKGIYAADTDKDVVKVYSWFAGLGLPLDRIDTLKKESEAQTLKAESKDKTRASNMNIDLKVDSTTSAAKQIQDKIKQKNSAFGKMMGNARGGIIDKRRK